MPAPESPLAKGQVLGRYELLLPVARGGMGQVWAARLRGARGFHKLVAIKTVLPMLDDAGRMDRMLFDEARIASLVQHSNVAQTLELGEHEGTLYLVMEWIDGEPLSYLLSCAEPRGGMPLAIAVNLVAQALRGLHAAHELVDDAGVLLGVVHRDMSPHNVLVTYDGLAKIVDFGIAKAVNEQASSTAAGEIKGKFSYMAPEQILGERIDRRADLFSVGIMLYMLTAGRHPFKNHNPAGVLHSITSEEPAARPSLTNPGYSRTLEAVLLKALDKAPEQRWSSAEEMRLALQRAVPHAFTVGAEAQLRAYLTELVGKRAARKREALREAGLALDGAATGSVSLPALSPSAQSASSLRAISIDTSTPEQQPADNGRPPTLRPPPPAHASAAELAGLGRYKRTVTVALGFAAAAALALVSLRHEAQPHSSASPSAGMADLTGASSGSLISARPSAPAASTMAASTPAASADVNAAPAPAASVDALRPAPSRRPRKPAPVAGKPRAASPAKNDDLIAPDYAR
jgi:serine/threonine protein kinase